jgi:hypothetical protein
MMKVSTSAISGSHEAKHKCQSREAIMSIGFGEVNCLSQIRSYLLILAVFTFAVGTLIAERPPHRSERARFRHSAPTLGV